MITMTLRETFEQNNFEVSHLSDTQLVSYGHQIADALQYLQGEGNEWLEDERLRLTRAVAPLIDDYAHGRNLPVERIEYGF